MLEETIKIKLGTHLLQVRLAVLGFLLVILLLAQYYTKFISDVVTRQGQNRDKTINITVQKRNNVDWNYVVDSSGNKTTVGL